MNKQFYLLFFIFCWQVSLQGQNFNERYRLDNLAVVFEDVFVQNDTVKVVGINSLALGSYYITKISISNFSLTGTFYGNTYAYFDSTKSSYPHVTIRRDNKVLVIGSGGYSPSLVSWGVICMMDEHFNPLWIKDFKEGTESAFTAHGGVINGDGTITVVAVKTGYDEDTYLIKFDSTGHQLWVKDYTNDGLSFQTRSMLGINDSTYLLGSNVYTKEAGPSFDRHGIMKVDSSGNILQFWQDTLGVEGRGIKKMLATDDGGVIFVGKRYYQEDGVLYSIPYAARLDSTFHKVWEMDVGMEAAAPTIRDGGFYDAIKLQDGNYVAVGRKGNVPKVIDGVTYYKRQGLVAKFTGDGEILWERGHNYFPEYGVNAIEYFQGVVELADGGLIACGVSERLKDVGNVPQQGWLVKMLPNGLVDSVNMVYDLGVELSTELIVYPNPTSAELNIKIATGQIKTVQFFTAMGEPVYSEEFQAPTVSISVSDLPKGVYFILVNGSLVQRFIRK